MACCITFGKCNSRVKYIFLSAFFLLFTNLLYGFKLNKEFDEIGLFNNVINISYSDGLYLGNLKDKLFIHSSIHDIIRYFGIIILSLIFYKYQINNFKKLNKNENDNVNNDDQAQRTISSSTIKLIHNSVKNYFDKKNYSPKFILFIMFLWVLQTFLIDTYYKCGLRDLDYWMFELVIVSNINSVIFNTKIYGHQKFTIYFNTIICSIFKFSSFIISSLFIDEDKENENAYMNYKYLIPIGISSYFIIMLLRSYVNSEIKVFMDLKYISPFKLIMIYGIIGFLFSTIISTVSTFISCDSNLNFLCNIKKENDEIYFENFIIYHEKFNKDNISTMFKEIGFEVIVNLFGILTYFLYLMFYVLIIKYLTPIHILFTNTIYYLILETAFLFIYGLNLDYKNPKLIKLLVDISEDFIAMIGFLINLEFIELNCCGLNYNLRKYIAERSIEEINRRTQDSALLKDEEVQEDKEYEEREGSSFSSEKASKSSRKSRTSINKINN